MNKLFERALALTYGMNELEINLGKAEELLFFLSRHRHCTALAFLGNRFRKSNQLDLARIAFANSIALGLEEARWHQNQSLTPKSLSNQFAFITYHMLWLCRSLDKEIHLPCVDWDWRTNTGSALTWNIPARSNATGFRSLPKFFLSMNSPKE